MHVGDNHVHTTYHSCGIMSYHVETVQAYYEHWRSQWHSTRTFHKIDIYHSLDTISVVIGYHSYQCDQYDGQVVVIVFQVSFGSFVHFHFCFGSQTVIWPIG